MKQKVKRPFPPTVNKIAKPNARTVSKPQPNPKATTSKHRVLPYDLTGFYESIPDKPEKAPALLLQLSQVGKMLVGWLTPPPDFLIGVRSDVKSLPNINPSRSKDLPEGKLSAPIAVLYADLTNPLRGEITIYWASIATTQQNKQNPMARYSADPLDYVGAASGVVRTGVVKAQLKGHICQSIWLVLDDSKRGNRPLEQAPHVDRLVKVSDRIRISNFSGQWLPKAMHNRLLTTHFCPFPYHYLDRVRKYLAPYKANTPHPLETLLTNWRHAGNKSAKEVARGKVAGYLAGVAKFGLPPDRSAYREPLHFVLRGHMKSVMLQIDKEEMSYYDWVAEVLGEEMENPKTAVQKPFLDIGVMLLGSYLYTLTFYEAQGAILKLLGYASKFKDAAKFGLHAGITGFALAVKKERVEFQKDKNGRVLYKNNEPLIAKKHPAEWASAPDLYGFFGDVGVGFSLVLEKATVYNKAGLPVKSAKVAAKPGSSGGGTLSEIKFFSNASLSSYKLFAGATFRFAGMAAPGASFGSFVSATSFKSKFIEFFLKNNVDLSTIQEVKGKVSWPTLPIHSIALDHPKSIWEGWLEPKFSARIFDLFEGGGMIFDKNDLEIIRKKNTIPIPPLPDQSAKAHINSATFFELDSWNVDQKEDNNALFSPRELLEMMLATERAVFGNGTVSIKVLGYTSPEATVQHNQTLSENRAKGVATAIRDAFGNPVQFQDLYTEGRGEKPAVHNGAGNPPDPLGNWKQKHPKEAKTWPEWRRVDVWVDGVLILSMKSNAPVVAT